MRERVRPPTSGQRRDVDPAPPAILDLLPQESVPATSWHSHASALD